MEKNAATLETRATCLDNERERKVPGVFSRADEKEMLGSSWAVNQASATSPREPVEVSGTVWLKHDGAPTG